MSVSAIGALIFGEWLGPDELLAFERIGHSAGRGEAPAGIHETALRRWERRVE